MRIRSSFLYFLCSIIFCFYSCNSEVRKIKYTFAGDTLTRFDRENTSYFFYGNLNEFDTTSANASFIKSKYVLFNDYMDVYLVFRGRSEVEFFIPSSGVFTKHGKDRNLILKKYVNPDLDSVMKSFIVEEYQIKRVTNIIDLEKEWDLLYENDIITKYE